MQASVRSSDRVVRQFGESLGALVGCVTVDLDATTEAALRAVFDVPHGNIYLSVTNLVTADPYVAPLIAAPDPQITVDKATVTAFMNAASGTATAVQRDDTLKAVIRYLRRSGNDA
jgi:hypothetical protein